MKKHKFVVFDIETDGLKATKLHCFCYAYLNENKKWVTGTITDVNEIPSFLDQFEKIVGHNIIRFDVPVIEKFTGIKIDYKSCIDTLALSWWFYPSRLKHGLEYIGELHGVKKPEIEDWENLDLEEYIHRCSEDVEINKIEFLAQMNKIASIYGKDKSTVKKALEYSSFKMYCLRLQEDSPFNLDIEFTDKVLNRMEQRLEEKKEKLIEVMPNVAKKVTRKKPNKLYKKDGNVSIQGDKWLNLLQEKGLPEDHEEDVEYIKSWNDPNPNSISQIKDWLFSLGWKPSTFKYVREEKGNRAIPQINDGGKLCSSISKLAEKNKVIKELEGYSVLKSRSAMLKGFLRDSDEEGFIKASAHGFTNTMRLKHKVLVNLPGVSGRNDAADGKWIRGCLTTSEDKELCGADITSLEDSTKQHYMWDYDPKYVKEMNSADYDPHIAIGLLAGIISEDEAAFFKANKDREDLSSDEKKKIKNISNRRKQAKVVNFSGIYGVGAKKLSLSLGCSEKEAKKLLTAYWDKNWSVKELSKDQLIITIDDQMWLKNPVSGFYYSLRYEKDIFSTLNQGTGVYVFDTWLKHILSKRSQLTAQFHDEIVLNITKNRRKQCDKLLKWAMDKTNEELSLNVEISFDAAYGNSYADVH